MPAIQPLLPRHREMHGLLGVDHVVPTFRRLGNRHLYTLDPAGELIAVRPVFLGDW